ncbi:related to beta transducin-like protein [Fusarium torulosum]|uniref:Related to beta transducin-like protein n=1 Tax=Fusarium torulosum TaxID=33205 RepID=A0AAE8MCU3_9HYPO|nr:related to beta transducin-like protein [Fusarium torulosum]
MRLINANNLKLETFLTDQIPPYAILSHRWGSDNEEVSFEDMKVGNTQKIGMQKVIGCCQQAKADDIKYVWIDTCCINKDSSKELDEAINSMFQWYRRASVCYTYLTDVTHDDDTWDPTSKFYSSSWFRRGWTLQELLAPGVLRFYSQNWDLLGTKADLSGEIEKITGIPRKFLLGWVDFHQASVAQRMSWASKRETKREEDMAYCLLGIFNVTMPMIYGEGRRAFKRLQLRIMEQTTDESILAWGMPSPGSECLTKSWEDNLSSGVFGSSPADFVNCGDIVPRAQDLMPANTFLISGGYVRTTLKLKSSDELGTYALLNCGPEHSKGELIAIPLVPTSAVLSANEYIRPQEHHPIRVKKSQTKASIQEIGIRVEPQVQLPQVVGRRFWLHIDGHQKLKLSLRQIWPPLRWEKGRALIANVDTNQCSRQRYLVQFSTNRIIYDVIVVLDFDINGRQSSVDCYTITAPAATFYLEEIGESLDFIRKEDLETKIAGDGKFAVKFAVVKEEFAQETIFYLILTETTEGATINANVHRQISTAKTKGEFLGLIREEKWASSYAERTLKDLTAAKKDLESFGKVLSELEEKERRLVEEKESVRTHMRQVTDDTRRLDQLCTLITAEQQHHKVQRKTLEATLDDTEIVQGPGNWFEGFIQKQLNKAREVQEKSDHSGTGFQQPKYPVDNQQNMGSFVPLLWAAANGQDIIAGILLEKGSSVNIKDEDDNTALLLSASCGHRDTASLLLAYRASLEAKNKDGDTPLARTAYKGHVSTAALLLEKGADIEALNNVQSTPLAIAARQGHVDVVTLLLQNGANNEAVNHYGDTALSRAATHGHQDVVRALLEKGAKVEVRNKKGFTPLQLAKKNGHEAVVKLLQFGDAVDDEEHYADAFSYDRLVKEVD